MLRSTPPIPEAAARRKAGLPPSCRHTTLALADFPDQTQTSESTSQPGGRIISRSIRPRQPEMKSGIHGETSHGNLVSGSLAARVLGASSTSDRRSDHSVQVKIRTAARSATPAATANARNSQLTLFRGTAFLSERTSERSECSALAMFQGSGAIIFSQSGASSDTSSARRAVASDLCSRSS